MSRDVAEPDPSRFGLSSFADLLPRREHIPGEAHGTFEGFRDGLIQSLAPQTPYEGVIGENIVAIEWELLQQRRMRDAALVGYTKSLITAAFIKSAKQTHEDAMYVLWDEFIEKGGDEDAWEDPIDFDDDAAEESGKDLARRATSDDHDTQEAAYREIEALGMRPVDVMSAAYNSDNDTIAQHDAKCRELEKRRREVMRDYAALKSVRPSGREVVDN